MGQIKQCSANAKAAATQPPHVPYKDAVVIRSLVGEGRLQNRAYLVTPHAGKDVVQLDVDGAEGQEASHEHLRHSVTVPG